MTFVKGKFWCTVINIQTVNGGIDGCLSGFFIELASGIMPYKWQTDLADHSQCGNRLIRIPTGFGKTLGSLSVWLWHRFQQQDNYWPRRLVWCLELVGKNWTGA